MHTHRGTVTLHCMMSGIMAAGYLMLAAIAWAVRRFQDPPWSLDALELLMCTVIIWVLGTLGMA
jgi:hypothetical protein